MKIEGEPHGLAFDGVAATFEVPACDEFLTPMRAALGGWPHRPVRRTGEAFATVRREPGGRYALDCEGSTQDDLTAVAAVCSLVVAIANRQVAETPGRLCFHGAAVSLGENLILIPGRRRAGKSTLVARLAMAGARVFGDDIVPLDDRGRATALGVAPRLRLPLPAGSGAGFEAFAARHSSATDGYYAYLDLPAQLLAPRGTVAGARAILLLDRRGKAKATLRRAPASLVLKVMARQNVAYSGDARPLLGAMGEMAARLPAFVLTYSRLDAAADLLCRSFERVTDLAALPEITDSPALTARLLDPMISEPRLVRLPASARLRQRPGIALRTVGGELFLAGADDAATLCHVGALGAAIWNLMAEPVTSAEAASLVAEAFPDIDPRRIRRDVSRLFRQFAASGFAVRS